jgi:hypothetical protein
MRHGKGLLKFNDASFYEGDFFENDISGNGKYKWKDGKTYVGEWRSNKMNGKL